MNVITVAKRSLFVLLTISGLALYALGASQDTPCPLPTSSTDSSMAASSSDSTQSPEKQKCLEMVRHNGMDLCLPCPAAEAHIAHGDVDEGPCSKPGNQQ